MGTSNARRDDWMDGFLREPGLLDPVSRWDYLPQDIKAHIMRFERHRLARDMIHRFGLALPHVKPCPRKDYDKLDFTDYTAYIMEGVTRRHKIDTRKHAMLQALREHITAVSFAVPWLALERKNEYHSSKHDSGCGFYAHLSWLCWTKRDAWSKKLREEMQWRLLGGHCVTRDVFEMRKIHFEALNLFCTPDALRKANLALIDHGELQ